VQINSYKWWHIFVCGKVDFRQPWYKQWLADELEYCQKMWTLNTWRQTHHSAFPNVMSFPDPWEKSAHLAYLPRPWWKSHDLKLNEKYSAIQLPLFSTHHAPSWANSLSIQNTHFRVFLHYFFHIYWVSSVGPFLPGYLSLNLSESRHKFVQHIAYSGSEQGWDRKREDKCEDELAMIWGNQS
jgi:hypothetical protein